ncbi:SDR family oxidoreductase [Rhabdobacter roseus]|uniref:Uncharacterized protein YbjT (DUF2867 family) n=1 Tax=Rhabdobacter roseus TaxID=1655419 RepID=A0A840TZS3_9BACT|nr:NmrA family NAD(P)-binding protein [Rhabdobacter roseus]MBB5285400.1 uncharacterized protein YbjT (DUF2867 family) [Rhabdobacter roseus]
MKNVLITGAAGNVGLALIEALHQHNGPLKIRAGVRNLNEVPASLRAYPLELTHFDFTDEATYYPALAGCDMLFLLRPPQLSKVNKYFKPLIEAAEKAKVQHVVFLSVQGVENTSFIPHHKIEKLIVQSSLPYTFLRPAYFMQNFSTSLRQELLVRKRIFLPAGKASFTLVDVRDVGAVAARILAAPLQHRYQAYDLTAQDRLTFGEMATSLSRGLGTRITYESPGLLRFFWKKWQEKVPKGYILVMIMLHYLPRFQRVPPLSDWVETLTGRPPISFAEYVQDHKRQLV